MTIVLPAEYNIDPIGIGKRLGLDQLNETTVTIQISDVLGENDAIRDDENPAFTQP